MQSDIWAEEKRNRFSLCSLILLTILLILLEWFIATTAEAIKCAVKYEWKTNTMLTFIAAGFSFWRTWFALFFSLSLFIRIIFWLLNWIAQHMRSAHQFIIKFEGFSFFFSNINCFFVLFLIIFECKNNKYNNCLTIPSSRWYASTFKRLAVRIKKCKESLMSAREYTRFCCINDLFDVETLNIINVMHTSTHHRYDDVDNNKSTVRSVSRAFVFLSLSFFLSLCMGMFVYQWMKIVVYYYP